MEVREVREELRDADVQVRGLVHPVCNVVGG